MTIALEAMMGVVALVTLVTVPQLHAWVREHLRHNAALGRALQCVAGLFVVLPALRVGVAEFDRRSAGRSPELIAGVSIGLAVAWFALSIVLPVWLLASRAFDAATKELFRLVVGLFMFSFVILLVWCAADAASEQPRFWGHGVWAVPLATAVMLVVQFLLLKLGMRLFPHEG